MLLRVGSARKLLTKCVFEIVRKVVPQTRGSLAFSTALDSDDDSVLHHIKWEVVGGSEVLPCSCHCVHEYVIEERRVRLCCVIKLKFFNVLKVLYVLWY